MLIEVKYPQTFWTPCVVDSFNLALRFICEPTKNSIHYDECKWIPVLLDACQNIRNFIMNHTKDLNIFKKYTNLTLLSIAEKRFASNIIMCKRLLGEGRTCDNDNG
ncbi:hypothetical protein RND81_05G044100 [Saponaria officinalis]|uniref:Uncharacterized protein n=1 Tax=Saponaria officinalis TaxID=3572 RepID=A0AAW1KU31_SAPOF